MAAVLGSRLVKDCSQSVIEVRREAEPRKEIELRRVIELLWEIELVS